MKSVLVIALSLAALCASAAAEDQNAKNADVGKVDQAEGLPEEARETEDSGAAAGGTVRKEDLDEDGRNQKEKD